MKWKFLSLLLIGLGGGLLISAILLLAVSNGIIKLGQPASQTGPRTGSKAPQFGLQKIDGAQVQLKQYLGKPVVLNFWATWCDPCKEEMPIIQAAVQKYGSKLIVLGINDDEPKDLVEKFVKDYKLTFPVLLDPGSRVSDSYQIVGFPTSIFIDSTGTIRALHIGSMSADQLANYLGEIGVEN